jgi:hypothetical protein
MTLSRAFREHAARTGHLYRVLLSAMADDWDAGGVVRSICTGHEQAASGQFVELRLLAALHRVVLSGRAPRLQSFYPNLGGTAHPNHAWPAAHQVLCAHAAELRDGLRLPPQTNEPGRSAALLVGLFEAVRASGLHRVRVLEPGASAGLNLLVDRYRIGGAGPPSWWFGPDGSPVVLASAVEGDVHPVDFEVIERRGCDPAPVDALTRAGRLQVRSYVWPDQPERHARLDAALRVLQEHPVRVVHAVASRWLAEELAVAPAPDVLTVVWQSITRLYWPADEVARVAALIAAAGARMPLAHIALEYPSPAISGHAELTVGLMRPGRPTQSIVLADVDRHGGPVRLRAARIRG